jgi:hypothetical protein
MAAPRGKEKPIRPARLLLATEQSAALRERLLASLGQLQSADEAADWVHANLAAKNTLIAADADRVESGFRDRLAAIDAASSREADPQSAPAAGIASPVEKPFLAPTDDTAAAAIILPSGPGAPRRRMTGKTIRCAIRSTASSWPLSPALSAAGRLGGGDHLTI